MTRNIYLEGELALKFGAQHSFHGDSVKDALRLLDANKPGFKKYFIDAADCDIGFHIEVGGQELDNPLECLLPLREGDIIITPIAAGSKSGGGKILAAVAIAALIMINPGFLFGGNAVAQTAYGTAMGGFQLNAVGMFAASLAVNLAMTGIQQLMAPDPSVDQQDEGYLFNGAEQNIVEGMPIPLLYGELRVPGYPVSFEMIHGDKRVTSTDTIITYQGNVYKLKSNLTVGWQADLEEDRVDILEIADPISGATSGATSQDILFTDIISEGPIYGLVDGGTSVFLNDDPAQLTDQSFVRVSETPVEFDFTFNSTSVTIDRNGHTKDIQADTENGTKFIIVRNYGSSSASVVRSSVTGSANSVTITSSTGIFVPAMEYDRTNFAQVAIIRLLDSNSSTVFEGYVESYTSSTVAKCIALPGTDLNPALSNGNYTVVVDGKFQVASISSNTLTLASNFPGNTGSYKCDLSGTNYSAVSFIDGVPRGSKYNSFELQFRTGNLIQPAFSDAEGTGVGSIALGPGGSFSPFSPVLYNDPVNGTNNPTVEYTGTSASGFGLTAAQAEEVDEVRVTFTYGQLWNRSETGTQTEATVRYNMYVAVERDGSFGSYQLINNLTPHFAKSNGPRIFEEIIDMRQYQPFTDFKVKVTRTTYNDGAYDAGTNTVNPNYTTQSDGSISALNSIIKENLSYPLTAMAKVRINSKDFQNVPTRTYHCKGVKVKVPSNYVTRDEGVNSVATYNRNVSTGAITSSYQDWDGNFRADKVYTNNPAWVFYDILTNNRYGLGDWLNEDEIDKYALYRIARYCDELVPDGNGGLEPRFTTNVYFTQASDAYKIVKDLATVFRSMIYWMDGEVYTVIDQPGDPIYNFSKSNVIDGAFGYETTGSKTRANQIVVTWNNPAANYKLENLIVEDRDNIINTGRIISEEAVAFGATTEGQALRYGRWKLWTAVNQTEIVSFKTAINAAFIAPGDIINIQDSDRYPGNLKYSGRVSNTGTRNTTTIPLDREIELNSGSDYELSVLFTDSVATLAQDSATIDSVSYSRGDVIDGATIDTENEASNILDDSGNYVDVTWKPYTNVETQTVSTSSGTGITSLTVSSAFSTTPSAESVWVLKESISGVEVEGSKKMYKILSISEESKNIYGITGVEFYNEKYAAVDENFVLSTQDPVFSPPTSTEAIPAPRNAYVIVSNLNSGQVKDDVVLSWDNPVDSNGDFYNYVDYFEVSGNIPGFPTTMKVSRNQTSLSGLDLPIGTFTLAVRTIAQNGRRSDATRTTFTIEDPARQAVPRAYGMALGATSSSPAFITSAGVFTIENQEYVISPAGYPQLAKQFDGSPATEYTQDCSDIPSVTYSALNDDEASFASHYIMFDASEADPFTLIKFYKDEDLGYSYFYDAGTGNTTHTSNWTSIGTVSVAANSNKVTGSGFDTSLQVGDIIKFSSTQAAKVVYIASATDVRIDKSFSTAISSVTGYTNSFRFDKDKDAVFYSVRNDSGTFRAFPVNYVVNPDLAQTIRFAKMSTEPGVLLFNADDTKNWEENSSLILSVITTGFSNPEFKVTGAGFSFVDESADTVFSSSNIRTLTLSDTVTYTSTFPVFTVTVREKNDPLNTAKQKTDTLSLSLLKDGIAGSAGNVGLSVYKATTTNSAPAVPSGDLTYTFATGALTEDVAGNLNGWTEAVPSVSASTPYIWVTNAVALGAVGESTDTIETGDWAAPALYSEGPLNSAIVELFQVTSSSSAPADPTSSLTYTFSTTTLSGSGFNGWAQTATNTSEGEYLWKIAAYALSNGTTDVITTDDWADAKIVGYSGTDGQEGQNVDIVFKRSATQPATPSPSVGTPTGWYSDVNSVPSSSDPLWASTGTKAGGATNFTWQTPVQIEGSQGNPGLSVAELSIFRRASSAPGTPTGGSFTFPASLTPPSGWYVTPPAGTDPVYISRGFAESSSSTGTDNSITWSTPVLFVENGTDGAPGAPGAPGATGDNGLRTIQGYLYYESTGGQPSAPSGNTYTFSTGLVSGTSINDGGTTNVWKNSPNTQDATSSNTYYTVRYYGTEASENSSTISVSYSNVVQHTSFTGVVTFSSGTLTDGSTSFDPGTKLGSGQAAADINSNVTTIDGGKITANSITANLISSTFTQGATAEPFYFAVGASNLNFLGVTTYDTAGVFYSSSTSGNKIGLTVISNSGNDENRGLFAAARDGAAATFVMDALNSYSYSSADMWLDIVMRKPINAYTWDNYLIRAGSGGSAGAEDFWVKADGSMYARSAVQFGNTLTVTSSISGSSISTTGIAQFGGTTYIGGGYGSTGITLQSDGTGSFNGNLTVDGSITAVIGSITAGGNVTAYSDAKLKENLEAIPNALAKVQALTGYTFDRKDTGERQTGLIAQDVLKILPEAVGHAEDGTLTLAYGNLVGLLVEAIKELKEEIEELKNGSSN